MDDRRFDALSRNLASGVSRRAVLRGIFGVGGVAVAAGLEVQHADAARRGFSGPPILRMIAPPKQCSSDYDCGGDIVCCVGDCCNADKAVSHRKMDRRIARDETVRTAAPCSGGFR